MANYDAFSTVQINKVLEVLKAGKTVVCRTRWALGVVRQLSKQKVSMLEGTASMKEVLNFYSFDQRNEAIEFIGNWGKKEGY